MIRARNTKDGKKSYQVVIRVKGYPDKVKTFAGKREAQNWELKTTAAMKSGRYQDDAGAQRRTLSNAIDRYISEILTAKTKNYPTILGQLRWWQNSYGKYSMSKITPELICKAKKEKI